MLKSYEAIYDNGKLSWLGTKPNLTSAKVIVVVEEPTLENQPTQSVKSLKGIVPKPTRAITLEEMQQAIELEGAKP